MRYIKYKQTGLVMCCLAILGALVYHTLPARAADPGSVVINEIMYNPVSGNQDDEFLELYNTTGSPIDLSGWSFSSGITLSSPFGAVTIPANGYVIVSPNATQTTSTYGQAVAATYAPTNLSNGGETVTLIDDSSQVIDTVTYDDSSPWPTSPDGSGPSLELKDYNLDNSQASSWSASLNNGGTPGSENSVHEVQLPEVSMVSRPSNINPSDTPLVTVHAENTQSLKLYYVIGFGNEQELDMYDDGTHGDSAASDNIYGATLPANSAGELVRYRVEAIGASGSASIPSNNDSMTYDGYVVNDGVTSEAPIMRWFVSDSNYADIIDNPPEDKSYRKCVIEYDGQVYDNTEFRLKGEYSRSFPKKAFKFKLPSGHKINMAGGSNREISEFHMNSNWQDGTSAITPTAWWVAKESGMPVPDISPLRVQRNNQFEGVYIFAEKYEQEWKQEYGFDTGNIYEDFFEKEQGDENDRSDIEDLKTQMSAFKNQNKRDYVLDNSNIPNILSFTAVHALLRSQDHTMTTNTFAYHDTEGTGRWSLWLWDLDLIFSGSSLSYISPYDTDSYLSADDRFVATALYQQEDIRRMYYRRLRTLADKFYANDQLKNKFQAEVAKYAPDMELDRAKWPGDTLHDDPIWGDIERPRLTEDYYLSIMARQKANLLYRYRVSWAIPEAQKQEDEEQVYIEDVGLDSGEEGNEYIKISNGSDEYVDISDWQIEGLGYTIPAGTVVPANGSVYLVKNDTAYRGLHTPVFIAGQYSNSLSIGGPNELVLKSNSNQEIDSYAL